MNHALPRWAREPLRAFVLLLVLAAMSALFANSAARAAAAPSSRESAVAAKLSATRHSLGLSGLRVSPSLNRACRSYANYMLKHGRWAHARHRGATGEILAYWPKGTDQPSRVVTAWMESSVHHAVIVGRGWRRVGVASATGRFRGMKATVWVVRFAR
jgi:uncharacterized protein YkwD